MRLIAFGVLGAALLALPGVASAKKCTDDDAVAAARKEAAMHCDCSTAENHGQYVKCVNEIAKTLAGTGALPQECKGEVTSCAARSTCGKPGSITCCRVDKKGKVKCSIKKSAEKCNPPNGGAACVGSAASCCDSCQPASADGAFVCEGGSTTTSPPSTSTSSTATPTSTTGAPTTSTSSTAPATTSSEAPPTSSTSTSSSTSSSTTLIGRPSGAFTDA